MIMDHHIAMCGSKLRHMLETPEYPAVLARVKIGPAQTISRKPKSTVVDLGLLRDLHAKPRSLTGEDKVRPLQRCRETQRSDHHCDVTTKIDLLYENMPAYALVKKGTDFLI